ncbi:hypothetical protein HRbin12_01852 [bacterium HR12]|nr:hypothetical protein HRbin12_01852 [bacterium HR12]
MDASTMDDGSALTVLAAPSAVELRSEGPVRYLVISGRQDDGLWGPLGALWRSEDGKRGGFLVHPWALWEGSEMVRCYRSALAHGWTPEEIYRYWQREVWPQGYVVDEERSAASLMLLADLVAAL